MGFEPFSSPEFQAILEQSRRSLEAGKGLSSREFWKAVAQNGRKKGKKPAR